MKQLVYTDFLGHLNMILTWLNGLDLYLVTLINSLTVPEHAQSIQLISLKPPVAYHLPPQPVPKARLQ